MAKTISQIRLENARTLLREVGSQAAICEATGRSQSQISAIMGENPRRGIGHKIARSLEHDLGKPAGWMDIEHKSSPFHAEDMVYIPLVGIKDITDHKQERGAASLSSEWIMRNLDITGPENLVMTTADGDAMAPTLRAGDVFIVDLGVTWIDGDGVYLIQRDDVLFVRRIKWEIDGTISVMPDNETYQKAVLKKAEATRLDIVGRVVWVWNGAPL